MPLKAFEMWMCRVDKVTNEEVLNLVREKISLYVSIKRRRDGLIGHTLRHKGLAGKILESTVERRKRKGRQRLEYVKQIIDDVGCSGYCKMKRLAQDKNGWRAASNQSQDC